MAKSRPYIGKDGGHYSDPFEMEAANNRYDQQQKLIEEQEKTNKALNEENQRIKNGGYTDREAMINRGIEYSRKGGRVAPIYLILCLIVGPLYATINVNIGIYIVVSGLLVESISAYIYNKKNKICHFFETGLLIISIAIIIFTLLPISVLKNFLPIRKRKIYDYFTIKKSK